MKRLYKIAASKKPFEKILPDRNIRLNEVIARIIKLITAHSSAVEHLARREMNLKDPLDRTAYNDMMEDVNYFNDQQSMLSDLVGRGTGQEEEAARRLAKEIEQELSFFPAEILKQVGFNPTEVSRIKGSVKMSSLNNKLEKIAKYLGTQGFYNEAYNLQKIAATEGASDEYMAGEDMPEGLREHSEDEMKVELVEEACNKIKSNKVLEAIFTLCGSSPTEDVFQAICDLCSFGITTDHVAAMCELGQERVMDICDAVMRGEMAGDETNPSYELDEPAPDDEDEEF